MADPRMFPRRTSYSGASDAGSSSASNWEADPDELATQPALLSAPAVITPSLVSLVTPFSAGLAHPNALPVHSTPPSFPQVGVPKGGNAAAREDDWVLDSDTGILTISSNTLSIQKIIALLAASPNVQQVIVRLELGLRYNEGVAELLKTAPGLRSLTFTRQNISSPNCSARYLTEFDALEISGILKKNPTLTELKFRSQPNDSGFFTKLAETLSDITTLEVLEISGNPNDEEKYKNFHNAFRSGLATEICELLQRNTSITTFVATCGKFDDEQVTHISQALKTNRSLTTLVLADNLFGSVGSQAIFIALTKNKNSVLRKLDLSGCEIDAASAKCLSKLLKKSSTLAEITVGRVCGADAIKNIVGGIKANQSLCRFDHLGDSDQNEKYARYQQKIDEILSQRKGRNAKPSDTAANAGSSATTAKPDQPRLGSGLG